MYDSARARAMVGCCVLEGGCDRTGLELGFPGPRSVGMQIEDITRKLYEGFEPSSSGGALFTIDYA